MMASCAAGVTVVGIDNGFGAACAIVRTLLGRPGDRGPDVTPELALPQSRRGARPARA